jgi:hypothetical protein
MHEDILCLHEPKRKVERDENDDDMMRFAVLRHVSGFGKFPHLIT